MRDVSDEAFIVRMESYEGPIEALLELARTQRVDLEAIDIVELVRQFETFIARAAGLRLELTADWLVMASWLTFLKSKILLRRPKEDGTENPDAETLAFHLKRLNAIKAASDALARTTRLGRDWFGPRGDQQGVAAARLKASLSELIAAYPKRVDGTPLLPQRPLKPFDIASVDEAITDINRKSPMEWTDLRTLVPRAEGLRYRSNIATRLVASLELTRTGTMELRQDAANEPIMVRKAVSE
ncbi:ScpA family protein [Roseibium sp. RKSG952]|uniref:segregation and condensation protein A n=1 Tax=Roseibium sp. RKSG952 TaxID=2529384 RepID=UPI0012BD1508|nr:ScpA family protein [Roseibium sp. RKSG952]MTH95832.1 segregation/condensation protein A [Roseibium sp. RKSG952]